MPFEPQPLSLPAPKPVRFGKSPLALVAFQIRFEHLGAAPEEQFRSLRDALAEDYPLVQQMQGLSLQLGPPGPAPPVIQSGWRFASLAQDWTVAVLPDSASIETTSYNDWEDFDRRLRHVLSALHAVLAPRVEVRLGLRYVNQFMLDDVTEPAGWAKYLRPELVALTATDLFAPSTFNAQQVLQLDAGNAVLTVRHGVPGGLGEWALNPFYLLDIDCFREGQRGLDTEDLLAEADRFNTMITSLFQWCLTDDLWKELDSHDK
jgi:uncharacterized protein (TIGR04255 family)